VRRHAKVLLAVAAAFVVFGATLATATAPVVSVKDATNVEFSTAEAEGTVNPEDKETSYHFEYATQADFSDAVSFGEGGPLAGGSGVTTVEAKATGLTPATTYHLRLVASNEDGTETAVATNTFETKGPVTAPTVTNVEAATVEYTRADIEGEVELAEEDPAFDASCRFEYVTQAQFEAEGNSFAAAEPNGQVAGCNHNPVLGTESQPVEVEANLSDLHPDTEYHLRLVATNAGGTSAVDAASTFETEAVTPPSATIDPVTTFTATTAHFSGTVNPNAPAETALLDEDAKAAFATHWHFECTPECPGLEGDLEAGDSAQEVQADASGLEPNTPYKVKLVATNAGGTGESEEEEFTTDTVGPDIGYNASGASQTKAILSGWVNPHNAPTDYHFEYGPADCSSNPCTSMPNQVASSGNEPIFVSQTITGLNADTTYHYRLVASNSAGTVDASDRTVLTEIGLPDNRAWEMVSPSGNQKEGADILAFSSRTRAAITGGAVQFSTQTAFGDEVESSPIVTDYIARRLGTPGTSGWSTHAITPYQDALSGEDSLVNVQPRYRGEFSPDLTRGVFFAKSPLTGEDPNVDFLPNLYLRTDLTTPGKGEYHLATMCPACTTPFTQDEYLENTYVFNRTPRFAGASPDFSKFFFESTIALTADAADNGQAKLYEYQVGPPSSIRLAGVLPDEACGTPPCPADSASLGLTEFSLTEVFNQSVNPVSEDGSRFVFTSPVNEVGECLSLYIDLLCDLYLRNDQGTSTTADDTTTEISTSERATPDPGGDQSILFQFATAGVDDQGNPVPQRVFFTSTEALTDDAPVSGGNILYVYTDSEDPTTDTNLQYIASDVQLVVDGSDDGAYLYYFTEECGGRGCIYVWHDDGQGPASVNLVARVSLAGNAEGALLGVYANAFNRGHTARSSPDGTKLAFLTGGLESGPDTFIGPTGYSHGGQEDTGCLGAEPGTGGCFQSYLYDATGQGGTGELSCMSCKATGIPGMAKYQAEFNSQVGGGAVPLVMHNTTFLTPDGRFVFFTTGEPLVPNDVNGKADAYEYEIETGQVRLISSGGGGSGSYFMDASADGTDAFFITRERLSSWDTDESQDIYDARIGGGFPERPAPEPGCQGDACQPAAVAPNDPTPGSSSFIGQAHPKAKAKKRHRKHRHKKRHHGRTHKSRTASSKRGGAR
jgi:hypothetical protein